MARRFPRNPGTPPRPFDSGPNPFADESSAPALTGGQGTSEDLFAAPVTDNSQTIEPVEYVRTLRNRSGRVLALGVASAFLGLLTTAILLLAGFAADLLDGVFFCLPTALIATAMGIPAYILGGSDLRAMRAGVMDAEGRRATQVGWWLGAIGLFLSFGFFTFALIAAFGGI
jgi:hypothetical protein